MEPLKVELPKAVTDAITVAVFHLKKFKNLLVVTFQHIFQRSKLANI